MNKSYRLRLIFHRCPNNNHPDADIASDIRYISFWLYLGNLDGFLYVREVVRPFFCYLSLKTLNDISTGEVFMTSISRRGFGGLFGASALGLAMPSLAFGGFQKLLLLVAELVAQLQLVILQRTQKVRLMSPWLKHQSGITPVFTQIFTLEASANMGRSVIIIMGWQ